MNEVQKILLVEFTKSIKKYKEYTEVNHFIDRKDE